MGLPLRAKPLERLIDANPSWISFRVKDRGIVAFGFDCPIHDHRLSVPLAKPLDGGEPCRDWFPSGAVWDHDMEDFASMTCSPSIHVLGEPDDCEWHGFIRAGRFETCGDSR